MARSKGNFSSSRKRHSNHPFLYPRKIKRNIDRKDLRVGVLTNNPNSQNTEAIFSIICEFKRPITPKETSELHRIAWNLAKSPLLIVVEPQQIRAWSCFAKPEDAGEEKHGAEIEALIFRSDTSPFAESALHGLHYIEIISGNTFKIHSEKFNSLLGAEYLLLQNLRFVRKKLVEKGLDKDTAHDLLARMIFIQFLFDKKDSSGYSALNPKVLNKLYRENSKKYKLLSKSYNSISELFENYKDTYNLFRYLNHKFNGDLFPGKAKTKKEREEEWSLEQAKVKPEHLKLLSEFVSGKMELKSGQFSLWKFYNFDAVPLEFISNVYEEFVNNSDEQGTSTVYTPSFLVDFILDGVLSWDTDIWNIRILDPACGSGIFLVKAYQRLIQRWKNAHSQKNPSPSVLRNILTNQIFGVDLHKESVRVASFSLYLAMLVEIDPKKYWNREEKVKFPILRNTNIINSDFFEEAKSGFRTRDDAGSFDLIIGNAPWGKNTVTKEAKLWANSKEHKWSIKYGDIGPLFLAKSALLVKDKGTVCMIQPAGTLLFDQVDTAIQFRNKILESFTIKEIINFSPVRRTLFKGAKSPACCITFTPEPSSDNVFPYINIKPFQSIEDDFRLCIDHWHDVLRAAYNKRLELESEARQWERETGKYIRPICLVQVERTGNILLDESYVYCYNQNANTLLSDIRKGFGEEGLGDLAGRVSLDSESQPKEITFRAKPF